MHPSPHLFSAYTEQIMRDANTNDHVIVNRRKISNLRYADDTALCGNSHEEATELISSLNEAGEKESQAKREKDKDNIHW